MVLTIKKSKSQVQDTGPVHTLALPWRISNKNMGRENKQTDNNEVP